MMPILTSNIVQMGWPSAPRKGVQSPWAFWTSFGCYLVDGRRFGLPGYARLCQGHRWSRSVFQSVDAGWWDESLLKMLIALIICQGLEMFHVSYKIYKWKQWHFPQILDKLVQILKIQCTDSSSVYHFLAGGYNHFMTYSYILPDKRDKYLVFTPFFN